MKRSILVVMLSLFFVLFLTACAADAPSAPVNAVPAPADEPTFDVAPPSPDEAPAPAAEAPLPDLLPDFDDFLVTEDAAPFDDADGDMFFSIPTPEISESIFDGEMSDIGSSVVEHVPPSDSVGTQGALPLITPADTRNRLMVYTVDVRLQTTNFMEGISLLVSSATELGGFLETADVRGRDLLTPGEARVASYIFRIPSENLAQFIVVMESNFNLLLLTQRSEDITIPHAQGEFTLGDLRVREAEILADLDEIFDLLADPEFVNQLSDEEIAHFHLVLYELEYELRDVRLRIRDMAFHQASLDDTLHYSTVTVTLREVIVPVVEEEEVIEEPEFGERVGDATATSVEELVGALQGLLVFIIRALPVVIIIALIGIPAFIITRKILKATESRREKKRLEKEKLKNNANSAYYGYQAQQNQTWNNNAQVGQNAQPGQAQNGDQNNGTGV